tara:strand:- start:152812 stop:154053 length:1242 start_codon:yes stop_codon:yes gene_type:complete
LQSFKDQVSFYNNRFAYSREQFIASTPNSELKVCLVVPAYNEDISGFLRGLNTIDCSLPNQLEIIIVLNHSVQEKNEIKERHEQQFQEFHDTELKAGIKVHFIKAFDLKSKHAGVGLARKIGMDEAVKRFESLNYPGLIVCLDADCKVKQNYFDSLLKAEREAWKGLALSYEHPLEDLPSDHLRSIINYEIFLRYYSLALHEINYPHYFQTVGSSMACRSDLYCKIGGMNRRKAGEDFYFLHKVFPHGSFCNWTETTVFPSPRKSDRVPFGTGKAMLAEEQGLKDYSRLYHPSIYKELKILFKDLAQLYRGLEDFASPMFSHFLKDQKLFEELKKLAARSKSCKSFETNFYFWFDGFKLMKFLHFAQTNYFQDIANIEACKELLDTKSLEIKALLMELRERERKANFPKFEKC